MHTPLDLDTDEQSPTIQRLCRYLSERSAQPMVAVNGLTHVVDYLNPAFARLVGRSRNDLIGRPFAEAVPEGAANGCLALLDRVYRTGTPELLPEQEHRQTLPRPVFWSYSVWAILDAAERPAGVMIQVTDVTETAIFRRQSVAMNESLLVSGLRQEELTEVGKVITTQMRAAVQTRDHFLAVLSHELRNPLTAMRTGLELLRLAKNDPATAENSRAMMERQFKQMVRLVDDLLDISRIATGKLELRKERVELAAVLRDAVEASRPLIDGGGHVLTVTLPPDPILVDADPTRLGQVFLNLLNNAAKYSERGGQIWLSVERDNSEVVVRIRDSGVGIPAKDLPHIFDVFVQVDSSWQRTQGGLGIGLSLVKEFVGLHGGRVEARSDGPGRGSEFVVRVPMASEAAPGSATTALPEKVRGPQRRIVIVDDNRDAAESLAMLLGYLGHKVRTAYDGEAGIAAAAEFRPQVVLMDIGMPGISGNDAARRIRMEPWGADIFLVALTGWGTDTDRQGTHDAGFDRHLVKPVEIQNLTRLLGELPIALDESN
ncbi:MAG TPA: ATP-binding protein [Gemmataceae bacterium]|jgi:PAS domain S-box-containing protein|nr:ATP-binding protein [Gemmataceae bacterium]